MPAAICTPINRWIRYLCVVTSLVLAVVVLAVSGPANATPDQPDHPQVTTATRAQAAPAAHQMARKPVARHHATAAPARFYRVRPGDCLSGIGGRAHTNWQRIWRANLARIGATPDLIQPGWVLRIPSAAAKLPPAPVLVSAPVITPLPQLRPRQIVPVPGPAPQVVAAPAGSLQAYAQTLMSARGWSGQWSCMNSLVMSESGWNIYATNPSSGAYGIPQALPGYKMSSAGADWATSGYTQLRWMVGYVAGRYGTPCSAWSFHLSHNWY